MMLLPLLSAWILGVLTVTALWPQQGLRRDLGLILPLGAGVGLGLTSALFYAASLTPWAGRVSGVLEGCFLCAAPDSGPTRAPSADGRGRAGECGGG